MSKYDVDLMLLYTENARSKLKEIAVNLNKSSQRLKYSLKLLEKDKVIYLPHCLFDYSYFGMLLFRVYFKGGYVGEKDKESIIKTLSENPYVVSIYELSGEYDLAIEMMSLNPSRFGKEIKKIVFSVPTLSNYEVLLNQVSYLYSRVYLTNSPRVASLLSRDILIGGDKKVEQFDPRELLLMKTLLENPTIRRNRLAKSTGLNIRTVVKAVASLKKRKIIKGFKYVLDTNKLDVFRMRLFLRLNSTTQEREAQLLDYFLKVNEVVGLNKTIGDWDMEVDIESKDKTKIRQLIISLREEFKDVINSFNSIEFYKFYKKSYLPRFLFEQKTEIKEDVKEEVKEEIK